MGIFRRRSSRSPAPAQTQAAPGRTTIWEPPPSDERVTSQYTLPLPGADPAQHRSKVRLDHDTFDVLVEFAVIQQSFHGDQWRDVWTADSRHGTVHTHRYARSTGKRTGESAVIRVITDALDIVDGYQDVIRLMTGHWERHVKEWRDE